MARKRLKRSLLSPYRRFLESCIQTGVYVDSRASEIKLECIACH